MDLRYKLGAIVISTFAMAGASAQNTPPGTTSHSESGQQPDGGAAHGQNGSGAMKGSMNTKSNAGGMNASKQGMKQTDGNDPGASAAGKTTKPAVSKRKGSTTSRANSASGVGDTPGQ